MRKFILNTATSPLLLQGNTSQHGLGVKMNQQYFQTKFSWVGLRHLFLFYQLEM